MKDLSNLNIKVFGLAHTLIDDYQFYGVEAATSVEVGNVGGTIIVDKSGTRYVYIREINGEDKIFGPFSFY